MLFVNWQDKGRIERDDWRARSFGYLTHPILDADGRRIGVVKMEAVVWPDGRIQLNPHIGYVEGESRKWVYVSLEDTFGKDELAVLLDNIEHGVVQFPIMSWKHPKKQFFAFCNPTDGDNIRVYVKPDDGDEEQGVAKFTGYIDRESFVSWLKSLIAFCNDPFGGPRPDIDALIRSLQLDQCGGMNGSDTSTETN